MCICKCVHVGEYINRYEFANHLLCQRLTYNLLFKRYYKNIITSIF